jgi:uncharacterized membrane protein YgcG
VQPVLPSAEAASGSQQPAGGGKKDTQRQRKERQRQRRLEEAREALQGAMEAMALGTRCGVPLRLCALAVSSAALEGACAGLAWRTHVWRCVWLQRGECAGRGGGGDGRGGEARGSKRAAGSAGGGG